MKYKSLVISSVLVIILTVFVALDTNSKSAIYNLGDAIIYNHQVVIGSTNMDGGLELFKLQDNKIVKTAKIKWTASPLSNANKFHGFTFSQEQGALYAYLVDGRYLYKYDISNLSSPDLVSKVKDNNWDYFMGVERKGDNILTFGIKGIKVWNLSGQVINAFNITNKYTYNLNYQAGDIILDTGVDRLKIYNKNTRQYYQEIPFTYNNEDHNRKTFVDQINQAIYLVDDGALKKYGYDGNLKNSFKHISHLGYDVAGSAEQDHLYFTDGWGIVKFAKEDLKPLKWAYTTKLGEENGWAMGLKVLQDGADEKIVIFNNSAILVLDQDLKMISHIAASQPDENTAPQEKLFLNIDNIRGAVNSLITLSGGGFAPGEQLTITLAGKTYYATAQSNGRFIYNITVPEASPRRTEIKVMGKNSGLSYSIGFEIL